MRTLPASPSRRRRPGSASRCWIAIRRAATSPGGTRSPVSPSTLTNSTPVPSRVLTTGLPKCMASSWTRPNASLRLGRGHREDIANVVVGDQIFVRDVACEQNAIAQSGCLGLPLQVRRQWSGAADDQQRIDVGHRAQQHVQALVVHVPPDREHDRTPAGPRQQLCLPRGRALAPRHLARIEPIRHHPADLAGPGRRNLRGRRPDAAARRRSVRRHPRTKWRRNGP